MSPKADSRAAPQRKKNFGGRSTAVGVGYEAQVAAYIASKMLAGGSCVCWDGINGGDIAAITMQDAEPVDDVVLSLRADLQAKVFISAKHRVGTIALTSRSPAFREVIGSFVKQYLQLTRKQRLTSRLMWAVPSTAGQKMTQNLREALNTFRQDAPAGLQDFLRRRAPKEREAMEAFIDQAKLEWNVASNETPDEAALVEFIRMTHVAVFDFGTGLHHEQISEETIRTLLAANSDEAKQIWEQLEIHFSQADRQGLRTTEASLRQHLASKLINLKPTPGYGADLDILQRLTERNLERLKDHTLLRFKNAEIHIERYNELSALTAAAKRDHLLVIGEPGCGKSGLIHPLTESLRKDGVPVVLLLAEEVNSRDWKAAANLPGLTHALDDVLAHWPNGSKGVLITDALDAVRDVASQQLLRRMLQDVRDGAAGWTVVASVREFDLKYGRQLRESFPGNGVTGHSSKEFAGTSHFYVTGLQEAELDQLAARILEVGPFIASARSNPRAAGIHKSPFFLRLAAELLRNDVSASRLADWSSPAILLRKFWQARVLDGDGVSHQRIAMQSICRRMTEFRSMTLSTQEVTLDADGLDSINELRSRGILQSPILQHGSPTGEDQLRFSHHLLHDYAIARSLIPPNSARFSAFTSQNALLPVFYRQSFIFALEELWDGPDGRDGFWRCALELESISKLHGISRILAPMLAARRVDIPDDLSLLLSEVLAANKEDTPSGKALRHLAAGVQDADAETVRAGAVAWCDFVARLSENLSTHPWVETPLVHILARLNTLLDAFTSSELLALNVTARGILANHVAKPVANGWRYSALTAIETLCRSFKTAIPESDAALLALLTPQRLVEFPQWDLFDLARHLKHLPTEGETIILRLFEAAFSAEPKPGEWTNFGGAIMPLTVQSSDNWNSIRYSLAGYYESRPELSASLVTDIACIAWNSAVRRRNAKLSTGYKVIAKVHFRGLQCRVIQDYGNLRGRHNEHDENRIITHFENLLERWVSTNNAESLRVALDHLALRNQTSQLWTALMVIGARHPKKLGRELQVLLKESVFFTHSDYSFAGIQLFAALHAVGDKGQRRRLEWMILDLPRNARPLSAQSHRSRSRWVSRLQNIMLGALKRTNIVLPATRTLLIKRTKVGSLPPNLEPEPLRVQSYSLSNEELASSRGGDSTDPANQSLLALLGSLEPLRVHNGSPLTAAAIDVCWPAVAQCETVLHQMPAKQDDITIRLWGALVGVAERMACYADLQLGDERWKTVRRILLKASTDVYPQPTKQDLAEEDQSPMWGSHAPRLVAAQGLLSIVGRLDKHDAEIETALLRLSGDKSHAVRSIMGCHLAVLRRANPELMWTIFDRFVHFEQTFSALVYVVESLEKLVGTFPAEVILRLAQINERANSKAPSDHDIHKRLAQVHLFHFLRTGDVECEKRIDVLVSNCDSSAACDALNAQLHGCRSRGCLSIGDAVKIIDCQEAIRKRTWTFFERLVTSAQTKLRNYESRWQELRRSGQQEAEVMESITAAVTRLHRLLGGISTQLYFASGAYADAQGGGSGKLSQPQVKRFWLESAHIFSALAVNIHPQTAHYVLQTLCHLLPSSPKDVFLTAASIVTSSSSTGYQNDSLAVDEVVKLVRLALADYSEIFKSYEETESECFTALLGVLDIFVEAGWSAARQLTYRLEEIYR